ncbi:rod-binding protein [Pararhizobium mangrovi]|uniref:Rod-binding protein n=1 Tax=Pararhizobium mangrovi TaxID=2590452 RepID=A0A506U119_9HYPH|nr:rod-binding protein [Pararhizobium mangrovi]TPW26911.1 rod-binding protein [Pararhizobium mangrovi]
MSISPPGDIVLDVVRAADPVSVREASERLATGTTKAPASPAATLQASQAFESHFDRNASAGHAANAGTAAGETATPPAYRKFEAMVLQSFIKEMLPSDSSDVYGKGTAGNIWKSMMAQQVASVVADRGGIGIADKLSQSSSLGLRGMPQSRVSGDDLNVSRGLVHQLQMQGLDELATGDDTKTKSWMEAG